MTLWQRTSLVVAVFLGILITHFYCLSYPPYEDQAIGFWAEAQFLSETGFDYYSLRYEEQNLMNGGSYRSYMISLLPTLAACLLTLTPQSTDATFLWHLLNILIVAWMCVALFTWLLPCIGRLGASLSGMIFVTLPAMVCPIETLGMEVPLMAASLWAGILASRGQYSAAAAAALLAFMMKASGIIISLAVLVFSVLAWAAYGLAKRHELSQKASMGIGVSVATILIERRLMQWADDPVLDMPDLSWPELFSPSYAWVWCPDLTIYTLAAIVLCLARIASDTRTYLHSNKSLLTIPAQLIDEHSIMLMSGIIILGTIAATFTYVFMVRYILLAIPFLIASLMIGLHTSRLSRMPALLIGGLIVYCQIANQEGSLYRPIEIAGARTFNTNSAWHPRFCPFTERSGEYRADLEATVRLIDFLSSQPKETPILTDWELVEMITRPKPGYRIEPFPNARDAEQFDSAIDFVMEHVSKAAVPKIPILYVDSTPARLNLPNPQRVPIEVLFRDGHRFETSVYQCIPPHVISVRELEDWYLDATWGDQWLAQRVFQRIHFLSSTSRWSLLSEYMRYAIEHADPTEDYYYPLLLKAWAAIPDEMKSAPQSGVRP